MRAPAADGAAQAVAGAVGVVLLAFRRLRLGRGQRRPPGAGVQFLLQLAHVLFHLPPLARGQARGHPQVLLNRLSAGSGWPLDW